MVGIFLKKKKWTSAKNILPITVVEPHYHSTMMVKPGTVVSMYLSAYLWALLFTTPTCGAVDVFAGNVTMTNTKDDIPMLMVRHQGNKKRVGKTTATVQLDEFMMGIIGIGGRDFKVKVDPGSRGTWVFGKDINKDYFVDDVSFDHTFYDEAKSRTFKPYRKDTKKTGQSINQRYAEVFGKSGYETLQIGDSVKVKGARFQIANKLRGSRRQFTEYDGMLGLERDGSSSHNLSIFSQMVREGMLSRNLFSVYMSSDGTSGEVMFGGWDKARVRGPIEVVDIAPSVNDGSTPWEVQVNRLKFGGNSFTRNYPALVYTDASITIPKSVLTAHNWMETHKHIAEALNKNSGIFGYVPCDSRDALPALAFGIGSRWYSLSGEDYTSSPTGRLTYTDHMNGIQYCALLVRPGDEETIKLGAPFFRKYYTIFFHDHSYDGSDPSPKIGFGEIDHGKKRGAEQGKQQEMSDPDYYPTFWCGGTIFGEYCSK